VAQLTELVCLARHHPEILKVAQCVLILTKTIIPKDDVWAAF